MAKARAKKNPETEEREVELTTTQNTEIAVVDGYEQYAGAGMENMSADDIQIPFLNVVQALSPTCKSVEKGGLGAAIGDIHNSVTNDLWSGSKGVGFVPAITRHAFIEWGKRKEGGGFFAEYSPGDAVVEHAKETCPFGKLEVTGADGKTHDLVETFYLYGNLYDLETEDLLGPVVIPFTATKIKAYKQLTSMLHMFQIKVPDPRNPQGGRRISPPLFSHRLRITTVDDQNAKGEYANIKIAPAFGNLKDGLLPVTHELFQAGVALHKMVLSDEAKVAYASASRESAPDAGSTGDGDAHF